MPVAKSFQNLKQWGEPFKENGRMYTFRLSFADALSPNNDT